MHHSKSYSHLRCPDDHTELTLASEPLLREVNVSIRSGRMVNRGGRRISEPLEAALVRAAGDVMYPIVHGIPLLLRDEAITVESANQ